MGVVGWIILGILFVAFAFFGLNSYLESSAENYAAAVNDQEISLQRHQRAYQLLRTRMTEMLGENYDPAEWSEDRIKATALQQLINETIVLQAAESDNYAASSQLVAARMNAIDAFKQDGVFSREQYERILGYQGMNPAQFEYSTQQEIIASQYRKGILGTAAATQDGLSNAFQLEGQQRKFSYVVLPLQAFAEDIEISSADIDAYYASHGNAFMTPERVRIEYLELDDGSIDTGLDVDDQAIQELYESQSAKYVTPEERRARHILISLQPDADEATAQAALKTALSVTTRLESGESFEQLAKELSDDPGSASSGGDLGFFGRGLMAPEFEAAVFGMQPGERSKPVKTAFGFHIIELMEIKPEVAVPLEEVRDELVDQLLAEERSNLFYEQSETLTGLAFEQPDSLQGAADALHLDIQSSDCIDKRGGEGIAGNAAVIEEAFSDDVLLNGNNSPPIEIGPNHIVVIRVLEHQQAAQQPLDSIREDVRQLARAARARELAATRGAELLDSLQQQQASMEFVATENGQTLEQTGLVTRNVSTPAREIVAFAFSMQPPARDATSYAGHQNKNGDYVIIALQQVVQGNLTNLPETARKVAWKSLSKVQGEAELAAATTALREQAIIQIPDASDDQ